MTEMFPDGLQIDVMLAASVEEQEKRAKDRDEVRESRRKAGMSEEEIAALEKEEDDEYEEELKKRSKRNVLLDLEVSLICFIVSLIYQQILKSGSYTC